MEVNDGVLEHLRRVGSWPDFSGTRYEIEREIGRGGLGVVYAAHDRNLNRAVAVKVLDQSLADEAQLIAKIEHPSVVPVYETGTLPDGRAFYAMKLVSGTRLDQHIGRDPSLTERLRIFRRIGEALSFAHSLGILHRDLKPQNVMTGHFGEVWVMDWGVEAVAGTPAFRAPEPRLDTRSDVYSLGEVLRFLLRDSAPPALDAVCRKAAHPDPAQRYPSVDAMLEDIDRFEQHLRVQAWREPAWHRVRRFWSRNALLLWLLTAYVAVKLLLFVLRSL